MRPGTVNNYYEQDRVAVGTNDETNGHQEVASLDVMMGKDTYCAS